MKIIIAGLLIMFISGCTKFPRTINIYNFQHFTLLDTIYQEPATYRQYDKDDGGYPIYYIGKIQDTIGIGDRYLPWKNKLPKDRLWDTSVRFFSPEKMTMHVDTSVKTCIEGTYGNDRDSILNTHAYLLCIHNVSDTALWLGKDLSLAYLYREVQNKRGIWVKIEKMPSEMDICGTSQRYVILNPDEIILAKVIRYKGDIPAKCRLVMKRFNQIVYSNVFVDQVERSLLD
ncbi:hypothetical protein [Chitinophaga rupis]|uniref:hypothetical protein n=1 Tax=Chitinophaga rupis TaxID=573321 RepID=UPI000B7FB88E|nr:hypothetical protein [Chitinophaga rupis]